VVPSDPLFSLRRGQVVHVNDKNVWVPAIVDTIEYRRSLDKNVQGSPQRYTLSAVVDHANFSIQSKDFKRDLRLEAVTEEVPCGDDTGVDDKEKDNVGEENQPERASVHDVPNPATTELTTMNTGTWIRLCVYMSDYSRLCV